MTLNINSDTDQDQFRDIPQKTSARSSVIDTLGVGFKQALQSVWNYVKTIELPLAKLNSVTPNPEKQQSHGGNINPQASKPSNMQSLKNTSPLNLQKSPKPINKSILPQVPSKDSILSKKQKLGQKKQHKKLISFDQFLQDQEKKLNESFIRKNIQQKKSLNKSILSQQNNLNNSLLNESKQNLNTSQEILGKSTIKGEQKPVVSLNNINNSVLNANNESILNVSDIDSECNFNILNNSELYDLNENNLKAGENEDEENQNEGDNKKKNSDKKPEPKLQLSDYPFMMRGRRQQLPKSKPKKASINSKAPLKKDEKEEDEGSSLSSGFIQFARQQFLQRTAVKRGISPSAQIYEKQPRKQVKQSQCNHYNLDESDGEEAAALQRDKAFDKIVEGRYEFMIDDMLKNSHKNQASSKDQQLSLKEEFAKYVSKNFGAMQHVKNRLQSSSKPTQKPSLQKSSQNTQQKKEKLSQMLKPVDLAPQIQRKKLYNFTRECQSKINISHELQKSVKDDKQRQAAEERRKKQEQEEKRRRQDAQRLRKEMEERKRLEEIERKRIQQEQQALRAAQELKKQQQIQSDEQKQAQQGTQHPKESQGQELKSSSSKTAKQDSKQAETVPQELKESAKQPPKLTQIFGTAAASLFKNSKPQDNNQSKDNEANLLKKTSSGIDVKSGDLQKKPLSGSKEPEVPSTLEKKETPKDEKDKKQVKYNPFMAAVPTLKTASLQEIVNGKKDDNTLFKTVISPNTPGTISSPQRKPIQANPTSFMSPVHTKHNTSHYSNLDSSMCEESESNITPSHTVNQPNLNGSFLNNSFSSQQQSGGLFGNSVNPLFASNTGGSMFGNSYNSMASFNPNSQQKLPTTGGLFGNTQMNMFGNSNTPSSLAATEAVNKVPSFMLGHPTIAPGINPQDAMSLFNQRSPTKNQSVSLFSQPSSAVDKRTLSRRDKKNKEERIKG